MEAYDMFDKMGYSFMVPTNGVTEVVCVCLCDQQQVSNQTGWQVD